MSRYLPSRFTWNEPKALSQKDGLTIFRNNVPEDSISSGNWMEIDKVTVENATEGVKRKVTVDIILNVGNPLRDNIELQVLCYIHQLCDNFADNKMQMLEKHYQQPEKVTMALVEENVYHLSYQYEHTCGFLTPQRNVHSQAYHLFVLFHEDDSKFSIANNPLQFIVDLKIPASSEEQIVNDPVIINLSAMPSSDIQSEHYLPIPEAKVATYSPQIFTEADGSFSMFFVPNGKFLLQIKPPTDLYEVFVRFNDNNTEYKMVRIMHLDRLSLLVPFELLRTESDEQFFVKVRIYHRLKQQKEEQELVSFSVLTKDLTFNCKEFVLGLSRVYINGKEYFDDLFVRLKNAQSTIFITDWWMCYNVLISRNPKVQLDELLREKAKEGVRIFIILFADIGSPELCSNIVAQLLRASSPNIHVIRHRYFNSGIVTSNGTHNYTGLPSSGLTGATTSPFKPDEKGTEIDQEKDIRHNLNLSNLLFHKNQNSDVENYWQEILEKQKDEPFIKQIEEKAKIEGLEIESKLVEELNFADISWTHHQKIVVIDSEIAYLGGIDLCFGRYDISEHPLYGSYDEFPGFEYYVPTKGLYNKDDRYTVGNTPRLPWQDVQMKVVGKAARDVSNVFLKLWNYAKQDIARQDTWKQWVMDRFIDAANIIFKPFRFWKKREQNPIFFRKMERCEVAKYPNLGQYVDLKKEETELLRPNLTSTTFVRILKSLAPWSAGVPLEHSILDTYIQLIRNSKYFIFIENQFFIGKATPDTEIRNHIVKELIERVTKAIENNQVFRLIILIPSHTEGSIRGEYTFNTVQIVMKYIFQSLRELKASITRQIQKKKNEDSSYDRDVDSFLQIIHLRNYGQKSEEYDYIVEEIYVHSKIMIVDDLVAIIGSANINDRSMLGSRDSEIACVVYDTFTVPSKIDGKPYSVARFAHNMRKRLWMSHFQLESEQEYEQNFEDIMSDTVWDFTRQIAKSNTKIYEELFDGIMSNNYTTWKSFIPFSVKKELQGKHEEQKRKLKQIKGQVCEYPLNFMMGTDWVQNKIADWITSTPMLIGGFV